jgi:lipoprotein
MRVSILINPPALLLAGACLLAGCGQKGPLYLPPEPVIEQATPAVTMPARQEDAGASQGTDAATSPRKGNRE